MKAELKTTGAMRQALRLHLKRVWQKTFYANAPKTKIEGRQERRRRELLRAKATRKAVAKEQHKLQLIGLRTAKGAR